MLHEALQGEWTHGRLLDLFGKRTSEEVAPKNIAIEQICDLLNRLQRLPETRIAEIKLVLGVAVRFGDNSAIEMHAPDGSKFLTQYVLDRDAYIAIMEHNRETDRVKVQEHDSLKAQVDWVRGLTALMGYDGPLGPGCCPLGDWLEDLDWLRMMQVRLKGNVLKRGSDDSGKWVAVKEEVFDQAVEDK